MPNNFHCTNMARSSMFFIFYHLYYVHLDYQRHQFKGNSPNLKKKTVEFEIWPPQTQQLWKHLKTVLFPFFFSFIEQDNSKFSARSTFLC